MTSNDDYTPSDDNVTATRPASTNAHKHKSQKAKQSTQNNRAELPEPSTREQPVVISSSSADEGASDTNDEGDATTKSGASAKEVSQTEDSDHDIPAAKKHKASSAVPEPEAKGAGKRKALGDTVDVRLARRNIESHKCRHMCPFCPFSISWGRMCNSSYPAPI